MSGLGARKIRCAAHLTRFGVFSIVALMSVVAPACSRMAPRSLQELEARDSLYVDPESGTPFTGPVVRYFADDPGSVEIEGALFEGAWHGDFRVYHPNGRIRYMGTFADGSRCGAWTENADSTSTESVYRQLVDEIESLGMYPPCPDQ